MVCPWSTFYQPVSIYWQKCFHSILKQWEFSFAFWNNKPCVKNITPIFYCSTTWHIFPKSKCIILFPGSVLILAAPLQIGIGEFSMAFNWCLIKQASVMKQVAHQICRLILEALWKDVCTWCRLQTSLLWMDVWVTLGYVYSLLIQVASLLLQYK